MIFHNTAYDLEIISDFKQNFESPDKPQIGNYHKTFPKRNQYAQYKTTFQIQATRKLHLQNQRIRNKSFAKIFVL